jgi:hypothetical protein
MTKQDPEPGEQRPASDEAVMHRSASSLIFQSLDAVEGLEVGAGALLAGAAAAKKAFGGKAPEQQPPPPAEQPPAKQPE